MKKFLSLLLSLCLITSLTAQAFAANSDVIFESDVAAPDILDVIVPAEIPIHMSQTGDIQIAQTLGILNKSSRPVEVLNIQVDGKNDWSVREFDYDFDLIPADTKDLALSFRGDKTDATGNVVLSANNWHIDVGSELKIQPDAKLPLQTQASKSSIATVVWTIDFAEDIIENPGENIEIKILPGDHGYCDVNIINPDSDGRVMSYPDVNTSTGYDCIGFVNAEDLSPVDSDTIYTQDTSIRPVFELKSGWIRVPVDTGIPGVTFIPEKNPEILIDPDGVIQVVPDVKPDDGFESDGFIDNNTGNSVAPGVKIDINITIDITINVNKIETPEQPEDPDKTVTIPVLPGENGNSDADSITTDKNGKIPEFPSVTPDTGFKFDHWEDQDGNPVDNNTEFKPGDQIKPVCKPDPDYQPEQPEDPDKTVTIPILPGENGNSDDDSITTDKSGKIPEFPSVTPDEGFKFDHWEDQNGNPVDSDTEFKPGDQIKPVCKPDPDYQPDLTVMVQILPGDHGNATVGSITTDKTGRIPTYPPVLADDGYLFDRYVDADGNPVDENTIFSQGSVIKPVFIIDPDYNNTIRLTIVAGKNCSAVVDYIDTDNSGRIPEFPEVIPNEGYEFSRWRDQAGNTITTETVFTEPCEIFPVCVAITGQPFTITAENRHEVGYNGDAGENLVIPETFRGSDGNYYTPVAVADRAFNLCLNLESVTLPNSVKTIGDYAFCRCDSLTTINIGNSITTIGAGAFADSANLTTVNIPNTVTTIKRSAFSGSGLTSLIIPDSVTSIGDSLCFGCDDLTFVRLSNNIKIIPEHAFSGCYSLTNVTIPNSITTIEASVFSGAAVSFTTLPSSVTSIGRYAFSNSKLTNFTVPDSVKTIGDHCFAGCKELKTLTFSKNCPIISEWACMACPVLKSVTIPYGVKEIQNGVFQCTANAHGANGSLTSISLPSSLRTIGSMVFYGQSINSLTVPSGVTSISDSAFTGVYKISYSGSASGGPYWGADRYN